MQIYRRRAIIIFVGCLLLWLTSAQWGGMQPNAQAAVPQIPMQKITPTPYVPPAEQGGNVNLVCGAAILVIIIISGVIWAQRSLGQVNDFENQGDNQNPSGQPAP